MNNNAEYASKYRPSIHALPDVLYELDQKGNFIFISDGIKIFGYEPERLIGKHFSIILHPDDAEKVDLNFLLNNKNEKTAKSNEQPKVFNERRTGDRITKHLELRILSEQYNLLFSPDSESAIRDSFYAEVHSAGIWNKNNFIGPVGILRNITQRKELENSLKSSSSEINDVLMHTPDAIIILSEQRIVKMINISAEKLLGISSADFIGVTFDIPIDAKIPAEIEIVLADDKIIIAEMLVMPIVWENRDAYIVSLRDQTSRINISEKLEEYALTDELTGLYNRRGFLTLTGHFLKVSSRKKEKCALFLFDVNKLKVLNDTFGHNAGDRAISEVSRSLKQSFRGSDIIARIGGDEFTALAVIEDERDVKVIVSRFMASLEIININEGLPYIITASVGTICFTPSDNSDIMTLLKTADDDLYKNKKIQ
ncbi:MAG: GGDEF domain-containing protein [Candidatus Omnitrophica bacterium]|nr:GGDEF domain-containing protein [Candidatus Omnitrophota bacterium]